MDCADAILSRRDLETRRKILKDSHVGSFAVIGLVILALLSFAFLAEADLAERGLALLFIPAVSRGCSAVAVLSLTPMETSSYFEMVKGHNSTIIAIMITAAIIALPILLLWPLAFAVWLRPRAVGHASFTAAMISAA